VLETLRKKGLQIHSLTILAYGKKSLMDKQKLDILVKNKIGFFPTPEIQPPPNTGPVTKTKDVTSDNEAEDKESETNTEPEDKETETITEPEVHEMETNVHQPLMNFSTQHKNSNVAQIAQSIVHVNISVI
jgi:hypothetical protein